jgi:hypothetical protein
MERKYSYIYEIAERMTSMSKMKRPNCETMLSSLNMWAMKIEDLKDDGVFKEILKSNDSGMDFRIHFIITKWDQYTKKIEKD